MALVSHRPARVSHVGIDLRLLIRPYDRGMSVVDLTSGAAAVVAALRMRVFPAAAIRVFPASLRAPSHHSA